MLWRDCRSKQKKISQIMSRHNSRWHHFHWQFPHRAIEQSLLRSTQQQLFKRAQHRITHKWIRSQHVVKRNEIVFWWNLMQTLPKIGKKLSYFLDGSIWLGLWWICVEYVLMNMWRSFLAGSPSLKLSRTHPAISQFALFSSCPQNYLPLEHRFYILLLLSSNWAILLCC